MKNNLPNIIFEVKDKKKELEKEVNSLIRKFESETGFIITAISAPIEQTVDGITRVGEIKFYITLNIY